MSNTCIRPSPAIRISRLMFLFVLFGVALQPEFWAEWLALLLVIRAPLAIAGLIPRSTLLGPNITHLPPAAAARGEVAITIDDGPDPAVTPRVLDILDHHGAKATFFCIGELAARHPALCREIVRRGHAVENHSQTHPLLFSLFLPGMIEREIDLSQRTLSAITGRIPRFFRATAGLRNPELEPVLARYHLALCSWSRRGYDTRQRDSALVLARLTQGLKGGDILLLHDGNSATGYNGQPVILEVLPRLLDRLAQLRLHSITLDTAFPPEAPCPAISRSPRWKSPSAQPAPDQQG